MARPGDPKDVLRRYEEAKNIRAVYEHDWRMAAAYCIPRHYSTWLTNGPATLDSPMTAAARRYAYDNTGVRSLPKWVAILNRIATPIGQRWRSLRASDPSLMRSYAVRTFFDELNNTLHDMTYSPRAHFIRTRGEVYNQLGVYGTSPYSITWRRPRHNDRRGGFRYKAWPLRDIFILVDDEGGVSSVFRRFFLNARQFRTKFPDAKAPKSIQTELDKATGPSETAFFEFVHCVHERSDLDPGALSVRRLPYTGYYVACKDAEYVGEEEGFLSNVYLTPRTETEPGDVYGYSPAIRATPALGSVNAMKKTVLKQGQRAVEPTLLANDDGVLSGRLDVRPAATIWGGIDKAGRRLVDVLPTGNFNVAENLIADERRDIEDSFFVTLFQILQETPEMTATEVVERVAEKAALLAPTMGWIQSEDLGPATEREIELMIENGVFPQMPPELIEARGEYTIEYTSPMAKSMYAENISGFMRTLELAINHAQATQDPSGLDWLDMDEAIPEIADRLSSPTRWIRSPDAVKQLREARAQQAQQQQVLQQAPALASVAKAAMDNNMA